MTDRDDAIELARLICSQNYISAGAAFYENQMLLSNALLSEVERSAKLVKALEEIAKPKHYSKSTDEYYESFPEKIVRQAIKEYGESEKLMLTEKELALLPSDYKMHDMQSEIFKLIDLLNAWQKAYYIELSVWSAHEVD